MTRFSLYLFLILMLGFSCKSKSKKSTHSQNNKSNNKTVEVAFKIKHQLPYCKGIAPRDDDEYRYTVNQANDSFFLTNRNDSTFKLKFLTNDSGEFVSHLTSGKYCLKKQYKDTDFESFMKKNKGVDNETFSYGDEACFRKWWNKCDAEFTLHQESVKHKIEVVLFSQCFSGENPCKYYKGPMPP